MEFIPMNILTEIFRAGFISGTKRAAARLFLLLLMGSQIAAAQTTVIPDTPAGHTLGAFLDAFNSGDHTKLAAYIKTYDPTETVDDLASFIADTGGFALISIVDSKPAFISFRGKHKGDGREFFSTFELASTDPPRVKDWTIHIIPPGATINSAPLDAAARHKVIDSIATDLTDFYIYPDVARKMIDSLHDHEKRGDYNSLTNGIQFATALKADLFAVSNDHHIGVDYDPFLLPAEDHPGDNKPHPPTQADRDRRRTRLEHANCQFSRVEILARNIGYMKFNAFADPDICGPTVAAAMGFIAHADAVIVDLRENGGGDPAMVQLIASYFFDKSTHINDLYNRHDNATTQYWTLPYVPGARMAAPLYILTSSNTFSGAEEFAYDMQTQKRATLVGETTGGGAHPVRGMPAGDHFMVGVPLARPINPITQKDWEGTGVEPEVKVPATDALATAQKLASERMQSK
jgi:Peptidase family S41/N-terminal domain of Peptidase_S41 in eukaryotic IRBP